MVLVGFIYMFVDVLVVFWDSIRWSNRGDLFSFMFLLVFVWDLEFGFFMVVVEGENNLRK